jgi:thioesterase domain-containing protein
MTQDIFSLASAISRSRIVAFRTAGSGSPLFCFPGGGGDANIFDHMVEALPEGQPIYVIYMESLCEVIGGFTIEQLAPFYLDLIRTIQKSGPYYFCGYSFGGLLAYEMALRLIEEGDCANLVAMLDATNPAMLSNLSQAEAAQFQKTYLADRLKIYGAQLMRGDMKAFTKRGLAFIVPRVGRFFMPVMKSLFRITKTPLPRVFRSNDPGFLNAWKSYVPKLYEKSLVLFRVEDRGPEHASDPSMGWDACVTGGVQVHTIPGSHVEMMNVPAVCAIAEKLATYLDKGSYQEKSADVLRQPVCLSTK